MIKNLYSSPPFKPSFNLKTFLLGLLFLYNSLVIYILFLTFSGTRFEFSEKIEPREYPQPEVAIGLTILSTLVYIGLGALQNLISR